ncbi:MAG: DUF4870 domain-containing protein [Deltaproteobacteria bacterium]|nr:DUF4870 domain-containing protein [Deltaproteobacteria bacterium]
MAHGLTFIEGGFIGPLVLYLLKKKESDFVAFHALQSLAFTGLYFLLTFLTCGLLGLALVIPYVVFEIIACIRAYEGEWYELPIVGAWARRKHPGNTMTAPPMARPPSPPPPPVEPSPYHPITPLAPAPLPAAPNPTGAPMPRFY